MFLVVGQCFKMLCPPCFSSECSTSSITSVPSMPHRLLILTTREVHPGACSLLKAIDCSELKSTGIAVYCKILQVDAQPQPPNTPRPSQVTYCYLLDPTGETQQNPGSTLGVGSAPSIADLSLLSAASNSLRRLLWLLSIDSCHADAPWGSSRRI